MGKRTNEPVRECTLSLICQTDAIRDYALKQSTDLNVTELSVLRDAMARAALDVEGRMAFVLTFGPGRAA